MTNNPLPPDDPPPEIPMEAGGIINGPLGEIMVGPHEHLTAETIPDINPGEALVLVQLMEPINGESVVSLHLREVPTMDAAMGMLLATVASHMFPFDRLFGHVAMWYVGLDGEGIPLDLEIYAVVADPGPDPRNN